MKPWILAGCVGIAASTAAASPVETKRGNVTVTSVRSPDASVTVELLERPALSEQDRSTQSLWVVDRTNRRRRLLVSRYADDYKRTLTGLSAPVFSLDGGYVYVTSTDATATSGVIHRVSVRTGAERFVAPGDLMAILRTGPYRGYLLVRQHRYYDRPDGGSYNPVYVIRPDGHEMFVVPGSENDDGPEAVAPWLRARGWTAF